MPTGEIRVTTDAELSDWFERAFKTHLRQKHSRYVWQGKEFEIRPVGTELGWEVGIYLNGKKVGPTFRGTYETVREFNIERAPITGRTALEELIELAKEKIRLGEY